MEHSSSALLCRACGLCCNGVLFDTVHLGPGDCREELKSLGMLIKHKKKYDFFHQPCSSFDNNCCSIYERRPERCRAFECQQLKRFFSGDITEKNVLATIMVALSKVTHLRKLLQQSGEINMKKSLSQQYKKVLAEPLDASCDLEAFKERSDLINAFEDLQKFLNQEFRIIPILLS